MQARESDLQTRSRLEDIITTQIEVHNAYRMWDVGICISVIWGKRIPISFNNPLKRYFAIRHMAARCVTIRPTGCGPIQWMSVLVTSCPSASNSTGGRDGPLLYVSRLLCWVCLTIAIVIVKGYLEKPGIRDRYQ